MSALIILGLIMAAPFVLAILFRVSAVYLFVGATAGNLFVQQFTDDAGLVIATVAKNIDVNLTAQLALQFLPVLLVLLFARQTVGKNAIVLHGIPLLFTSVMFGILALHLLPVHMVEQVYASSLGPQLQHSEGLIIGVTALTQLLLILSSRQPNSHKHKRGHAKH